MILEIKVLTQVATQMMILVLFSETQWITNIHGTEPLAQNSLFRSYMLYFWGHIKIFCFLAFFVTTEQK